VFTFRRAADIDEKRPFLERRKIKQVEIRKNAAQIRQLAPTDEDQLAAGTPSAGAVPRGRPGHNAVLRERAIVVARQCDEIHSKPSVNAAPPMRTGR
jgi:hypothetical protein